MNKIINLNQLDSNSLKLLEVTRRRPVRCTGLTDTKHGRVQAWLLWGCRKALLTEDIIDYILFY
jgi:hypothetical protein